MVNVEMFRNAFVLPSEASAKKPAVQEQPVQQEYPEDQDIAKLKFLMLKWLSIIIGGSAVLLIVWRIALKFI